MDDGGDEVLDELGAEGQRCDVICSNLNLLVLPRTYEVTGTVGMGTFAEVQEAMEIVYPSFEACVEGLPVDVFRGCRHGSFGTVYALVVWGRVSKMR